MAETGAQIFFDGETQSRRIAAGHGRLRQRLLCGLSAFAFLVAVTMPVTFDAADKTLAFKTALAGHENGTGNGQGRGNGNGNGRGDDNGGGNGHGGNKGPGNNDDDDDDVGNGQPPASASGGGGGGMDDPADDIDEATYAGSVDAVSTTAPTDALPTVHQVFSLNESSVLTPEQELQAIQNGWSRSPK